MRRSIAIGIAVVLAAGGTALARAGTSSPGSGGGVDPSNFVRHVTNSYFPLKPGTVWVYRGIKDGRVQIDRVTATHQTRKIEGVTATAVRDVATHGKHVLEATTDWYAQDKQGNVWYFGEATKAYENGKVDTSGSWLAGRDNARPGIIMEADPKVATAYRQEYYKGQAEDQAWVVQRGGHVRVPYGTVRHILFTLEWSRLEPNVIDRKDYAPGIGIVKEISASGPRETANLVRVQRSGR